MVLDTGLNWMTAVLPHAGIIAGVESHETADPPWVAPWVANEQRDLLGTIIANVHDAVVAVNRLGDVLAANPAFERLLAEAGGSFLLFDPAGRPVPPEATPFCRAARSETADLDLVLRGQAQTERLLHVTVRPVQAWPSREAAGVVVIHDLGERQSERLEERLVALLGHELRTPVSSLQTYAEFLIHYLDDNLDSDQAQKSIRRIHELSGRIGMMIQDLFEMARNTAGKMHIRQEIIDPEAVVMSAVEMAESLPNTPPIRVQTVGDVPLIRGDAQRLSSVVLNLVTNASKHAHGTKQIDIRIRIDGEDVAIDVEDAGPGIPPDDLALILTPYYRTHRTAEGGQRSAGHDSGLGLGLFIAQQIVSAHDGRIAVTSKLAVGTRFTVYLPRH